MGLRQCGQKQVQNTWERADTTAALDSQQMMPDFHFQDLPGSISVVLVFPY